jgi:hypothetical protein
MPAQMLGITTIMKHHQQEAADVLSVKTVEFPPRGSYLSVAAAGAAEQGNAGHGQKGGFLLLSPAHACTQLYIIFTIELTVSSSCLYSDNLVLSHYLTVDQGWLGPAGCKVGKRAACAIGRVALSTSSNQCAYLDLMFVYFVPVRILRFHICVQFASC